jgi:hypothetical protein
MVFPFALASEEIAPLFCFRDEVASSRSWGTAGWHTRAHWQQIEQNAGSEPRAFRRLLVCRLSLWRDKVA